MPKNELGTCTIECSHALVHWLWLCALTLIICPASFAATLSLQFTWPWYRIQYYLYDLETDKLQIKLRNKSWTYLKLLFLQNCCEIILYTLRPNQEIRKEIEIVWFLIKKVCNWKATSWIEYMIETILRGFYYKNSLTLLEFYFSLILVWFYLFSLILVWFYLFPPTPSSSFLKKIFKHYWFHKRNVYLDEKLDTIFMSVIRFQIDSKCHFPDFLSILFWGYISLSNVFE